MKKTIGSIALLILALGSCRKNNLDITPVDRVAETAVWTDSAFTKAYHTELYNALPHNFGIHMYSKLTDEAYNAVPGGQGPEPYKRNTYNPDNIGSTNNGDNNWMYYWNRGYQYIRKPGDCSVRIKKSADCRGEIPESLYLF